MFNLIVSLLQVQKLCKLIFILLNFIINAFFSHELPLIDYIQMYGNFVPGYITSGFYPAGYFDEWSLNTQSIEGQPEALRKVENTRMSHTTSTGDMVTYDLLFKPPSGILNSSKPLLPKTEMIISFDRASSEIALLNKTKEYESPLAGKVIELTNVFLRANYLSSPFLRSYFDRISTRDITYKYDECAVYHKSLPQGSTIIRMANIVGGNTPAYLFAGVIKSSALNGSYLESSTRFERNNVCEFDLTLDGYSVNDFPITSENNSAILVYEKFLRTTNRKFNNKCAEMMNFSDFKSFHYIYGHKFSGEVSEQGWIGVNLKLEQPFEENMTLGKTQIINMSVFNFFSSYLDITRSLPFN